MKINKKSSKMRPCKTSIKSMSLIKNIHFWIFLKIIKENLNIILSRFIHIIFFNYITT